MSSRSVPVQRDSPTSDICFSKTGFFCNGYQLYCRDGTEVAENVGCGGSCREVFGCARLEIRRVTGCVKW